MAIILGCDFSKNYGILYEKIGFHVIIGGSVPERRGVLQIISRAKI
jgi:hypothetical protein